ncbi:MAG TPA: EamA family transporter [Anaeromyxobacter sp.]|nr:EamA family transporter [Anaeromyxobacter sp.]
MPLPDGVQSRLLLLAAAALWSTAGAAMKLCGLQGLQIAGGRSLVAGVFLLAVLPGARRWPSRRMILGVAGYAATVVLFATANKLTTAANAIFIQSSAPLWVLVLSPAVLRERADRSELLAIPVYALGLSLFFLDDLRTPGQLQGNLVALAAGLTFGLCIMGLRRAQEDAEAALVWGNLLAAAAVLPLWGQGPAPAGADLLLLAYLGVFQLGLAYLCFARGIARVPALEASLLVLLEPILNPIWTFAFTGERPGPWALAGAGVVLAATVWRTAAPALARRAASSRARSGAAKS